MSDDAWYEQAAARGMLGLPLNPFEAMSGAELKDPRKMRAAERRRAAQAEVDFDTFLLAKYAGENL